MDRDKIFITLQGSHLEDAGKLIKLIVGPRSKKEKDIFSYNKFLLKYILDLELFRGAQEICGKDWKDKPLWVVKQTYQTWTEEFFHMKIV